MLNFFPSATNLRPQGGRSARAVEVDEKFVGYRGLASVREKGEIGCRSRGDRGDSPESFLDALARTSRACW